MATPNIASNLSGLALRLVRDNLLSTADAENLQAEAVKKKIPFVTHLVQKNLVDERSLALSATEEFGVSLLDLDAIEADSLPAELVSDSRPLAIA